MRFLIPAFNDFVKTKTKNKKIAPDNIRLQLNIKSDTSLIAGSTTAVFLSLRRVERVVPAADGSRNLNLKPGWLC